MFQYIAKCCSTYIVIPMEEGSQSAYTETTCFPQIKNRKLKNVTFSCVFFPILPIV
jgi:hypothetical protein